MKIKYLIISVLLMLSAVLGTALKPHVKVSDISQKVDLEKMIPEEFAGWKMLHIENTQVIDPQRLETIKRIYNQTLSRTYANASGDVIMLSIAYGGNQSDDMGVHRPEVCYPAQGLEIIKQADGVLNTGFGEIPVRKLVANRGGNQIEPVTYWITVGNTIALNKVMWKLAQVKYGLTGKIPDGIIFRVSNISDETHGYEIQQKFVSELLDVVKPEDRTHLIGNLKLNNGARN